VNEKDVGCWKSESEITRDECCSVRITSVGFGGEGEVKNPEEIF
jgi:hypothetical protein